MNELQVIVSIHAPAWGATCAPPRQRRWRHSFNPRARVGRDGLRLVVLLLLELFQSTRPRGARRSTKAPSATQEVSIHAPAWGATRRPAHHWPRRVCFNPRARVGRDLLRRLRRLLRLFQSTRPRGARLVFGSASLSTANSFNPRARVGRDRSRWQFNAPRGAMPAQMFQSTRPRGARRFHCNSFWFSALHR